MEDTQIPKQCRAENSEKRKKLSFEWTQTPRHSGLVKRIPKEKACPRGKRQL